MSYQLLDFTKPAKVKIDAGFEDGPTGGYVPQMSKSDAQRWKARHFNLGKENARVELRKNFKATQVFIIVALDGWDLAAKHECRDSDKMNGYYWKITKGLNVRMTMNGPLLMTFDQFNEINQIVEEAKMFLSENPADTT